MSQTTLQMIGANHADERAEGAPDRYEVGRNCDAIEQDDSGRWWVKRALQSFQVPDHRILVVSVVRLPTVADNSPASLPPGLEKPSDGEFKCKACGRMFTSMHGWKIHYGREHQG